MANTSKEALANDIKALTFDVFGTVVDWRSSVEAELKREAERKINSPSFDSLSEETQSRAQGLTDEDWSRFAVEWRTSYYNFTRGFVPGETEWKDIDTHHYESLVGLLKKWGIEDFYDEKERQSLSQVWHRLKPWPDSSKGLHMLGKRFDTATLSNGNESLLRDLNAFGDLGFQKIISAADFGAYKPNPAVYLGAARVLNLQPGQVAMVAAHLGDLYAAKSLGLRTVYVERPDEEGWERTDDRYQAAKEWVDMWIAVDGDGFVEVARRLGAS